MKLGMGIRGAGRTDKNYIQYLAQIGAPNAVVFMPDKELFPVSKETAWTVDELTSLKKFYKENGVTLQGFENFHPKAIYKIILDLEGKEEQLENIKRCIDNMGKACINLMGYNFSVAGVTSRVEGPFARGGAKTAKFTRSEALIDEKIPRGQMFNRVVDENAPKGDIPFISLEEMKQRRDWFLSEILPVAEQAGVKMSAHPEDPPIPVLKNSSRILINTKAYDELFEKFDSPCNCIEFCQGTFAELGVDIYDTIEYFAKKQKIGYVHFRNIVGKADKEYTEVFIDDGDVNMIKALQSYKNAGYDGLLMPDHTPLVNLPSSNEIGMAYAIGYMRGIMQSLDIEIN